MYIAMVVLLIVLLPAASVLSDYLAASGATPLMPLIGKWFVFWAAGVRLFTAGLRQFTKPEFTARDIFHMKGDEALPVVRELGIANIALGAVGIASLWRPDFVLPVAIAAAIFYGMAGWRHILEKDKSTNETVAMATDLIAFAVLAAYAVNALL